MATRNVYRSIPFDGLRTGDGGIAPDEYIDHVNDGDRPGRTLEGTIAFAAAEYNIEPADVAYRDPETGEWVEVDHWRAMVNPAWTGDPMNVPPVQTEAGKGAAWDVPTREYTPIGPEGWWEPLVDALDAMGVQVFGELRLSRSGGVQVVDVFLDDHSVAFPNGPDKPLGVSTGHDFFGGRKLSASVIALDVHEDTSVSVWRQLTDARTRKHTGGADDEVVEWWESVLRGTDRASETLYGVVTDAMAYDMDLASMPCTIPEFYAYLGLPETTLAKSAADRAIATCQGQWDAYHLHRSAIHAIEHEYGGKDSRRFASHIAAVNPLLFNPPRAERDVLTALRADIDEEQAGLDAQDWDAKGDLQSQRDDVADRIATIPEAEDAFRSARDRLRTMLTDLETADADEEAAA